MGALFATPIRSDTKIPYRYSPDQASFALYADEEKLVKAHGSTRVKTGCKLKIPMGSYGRISSDKITMLNHGLISDGVVEPNDDGEIDVIIINTSAFDYCIYRGDKIALLTLDQYVNTPCLSTLAFPCTNCEDVSKIHDFARREAQQHYDKPKP
jgi:dUTP pyrophosphatase